MKKVGLKLASAGVIAIGMLSLGEGATAYTSSDGKTEVHGFVENSTFNRKSRGLSKVRNTAQMEISHEFAPGDVFSGLSFHGIFRGTYDGVYDFNRDEFGDRAGGAIQLQNLGGGNFVPHGGGIVLPGGDFDSVVANPNAGLVVLGQELHGPGGGVTFGVPVRPCDIDRRGCIDDYLDFDQDDLRFPEFNNRLDFIREAYIDASIPLGGDDEIGIRFGKQQVVWGRTDLFRVLDVLNPVDFSRQNIYDELEDIRIPMWMLNAEYRLGRTAVFDDLNFQAVWNFDRFRPSNLGQGGSPYAILDAGSLFRGLKNCWDNGCTVSNFAGGVLATDFAPGVIGIRQANLPGWSLDNTQIGGRIEGVYDGVGFSLNALTYRSHLPSLRGGIPADNPFTPAVESQPFPYLVAFDIAFPRVNLYGGSLDFYVDSIKTAFRVEGAYTTGEEFANTLRPELFSDSDVFRYVIGADRQTFIPFLNENRSFLISGQLFGQHILDHERGSGVLGAVGMPDFEANWIATLLLKGFYMNDRLSPQVITAYDFGAQTAAIAPSVDWLISDNWQLTVGANIKIGEGARTFDDCRTCNPFPPFTGPPPPGSLGLGGFEPLGRFRAGPIGMAEKEDELQLTLRYRF